MTILMNMYTPGKNAPPFMHASSKARQQNSTRGTRQTLDAVSPPLTGGARRARVLGTCAVFVECRRASTRQKGHVAECHFLPTAGTRQR